MILEAHGAFRQETPTFLFWAERLRSIDWRSGVATVIACPTFDPSAVVVIRAAFLLSIRPLLGTNPLSAVRTCAAAGPIGWPRSQRRCRSIGHSAIIPRQNGERQRMSELPASKPCGVSPPDPRGPDHRSSWPPAAGSLH